MIQCLMGKVDPKPGISGLVNSEIFGENRDGKVGIR